MCTYVVLAGQGQKGWKIKIPLRDLAHACGQINDLIIMTFSIWPERLDKTCKIISNQN